MHYGVMHKIMAESVILHIRTLEVSKIINWLNSRLGPSNQGMWQYPKEDYLVIVTEYSDMNSEYDEEEIDRISSILEGSPTISLDFEIRRSKSSDACTLIESTVRSLSEKYTIAVDDMCGIHSISDIDASDSFLAHYRY